MRNNFDRIMVRVEKKFNICYGQYYKSFEERLINCKIKCNEFQLLLDKQTYFFTFLWSLRFPEMMLCKHMTNARAKDMIPFITDYY